MSWHQEGTEWVVNIRNGCININAWSECLFMLPFVTAVSCHKWLSLWNVPGTCHCWIWTETAATGSTDLVLFLMLLSSCDSLCLISWDQICERSTQCRITCYILRNYVLRQMQVSWKTWQLRVDHVGFIRWQAQLAVGTTCVWEAIFIFCTNK